jgi:hypothetical protein
MTTRTLLVAATALVCVVSAAFAQGPADLNRTVEQYKCRDIMRENSANRDISIAFLHGYLLGKTGGQNFNLDALHKQTEAFIEHCLSNPDGKAVDSMMAVKK